MLIGLVTDVHYCSKESMLGRRFPKLALQRLKEAVEAFTRAGVELIVCLGDLIDLETDSSLNEENLRTASGILKSAGIPCVCLMGNHDRAVFTPEEFAAVSGLQTAPCALEHPDFTLHFLDSNFFWDGTPYTPEHIDWTQSRLSPDGMAHVEAAMADASRRHFFFMHQCLDPDVEYRHILHDAPEINALLATGRTAAVFAGHFHKGRRSIIGKIPYITLSALCEGPESSALLINTDDYPA